MMNPKVVTLAVVMVLCIGGVVGIFVTTENEEYDLVIACGSKNCYEPFWIAEDRRYFEGEGVNVKMSYVDGGGNAMTALLSGSADLTLVGADPAIRMFESVQGGYVIATVETGKSNTTATDFAYLTGMGIDLDDASSFFEPGTLDVRVVCGLDTTTGYFSGYIEYLYNQKEVGNITEEQYSVLRTVSTDGSNGGIKHVEFANQAASLINGDVQMICSGNTVAIATQYPNVEAGTSSFGSVVGGCVIVASKDACENKADALIRVLRALDRACALIEDPDTVDDVSAYCAERYGAEGWTAETQKRFFSSYYWDICNMLTMESYLERKAALIDEDYADHDYSSLILTDLVVRAHETIDIYDGKYTYDSSSGTLVDGPTS